MRLQFFHKGPYILLSLLALLLSACRAAPTQSAPTPTAFPTFNYVVPTVAPVVLTVVSQAATASSTAAPDPAKIDLGKGRYVALECGSCHGDAGQGTPKGSALAGTKLSQADFITYLRSGGKVGNSHLYSTNRLSETGAENLYLYVLSLGPSK